MSESTGVSIVPAASAEDVVRGSDLIGTVTTAATPLFEAEWLEAGAHINAAGSNALVRQEISEAVVRLCDPVVVDAVPTALAEAGDLLPLLEKGRLHSRRLVELGDILVGRRPGRTGRDQITLFESQGLAIQDIAVASALLDLAGELGVGTDLPLA
jgi:ornithine cyclodeaminase